MDRTIVNPIIKDKVTFIQTAQETDGRLTWVRVELSPQGGSELHYHKHFTETFLVQKGTLEVTLEKETQILKDGETVRVSPFIVHKFYNPNDHPIVFDVKIEPASVHFEAFLQIMYGLARDGKTNRRGIPRNPLHIGAISLLGETFPPRWSLLGILSAIFRYIGHWAAKRGVLSKLKDQYVQF